AVHGGSAPSQRRSLRHAASNRACERHRSSSTRTSHFGSPPGRSRTPGPPTGRRRTRPRPHGADATTAPPTGLHHQGSPPPLGGPCPHSRQRHGAPRGHRLGAIGAVLVLSRSWPAEVGVVCCGSKTGSLVGGNGRNVR